MPKNGNITGQVFDENVIKQIEARQNFLGARYRTDANLVYSNNQNAFLRLASSINVGTSTSPIEVTQTTKTDDGKTVTNTINDTAAQEKATSDLLSQGRNQLGERGINQNLTGMELAKSCVLFGGTVGVDNLLNPTFKYGIVDNGGSGAYDYVSTIAAYGWGGISKKGFVPMPSIESADVSFYNRGALQKASVKIKVYSLEQLQIFDVLYFRIGYTMLLEWGHNIWLDNNLENNPNPINERREFTTDPFKLFFTEGSSQQDIIKAIQNQRNKENYNYDAMLGKVTNFTWKFNEDGSYDIDLNLVGLGDIIESLKVNKANIVTNKTELTPSQAADKKQSNLDNAYKAADAQDTAADSKVEQQQKDLQAKVDRVNQEIKSITDSIKRTVSGMTATNARATRDFKTNTKGLSITVGTDVETNNAAGDQINQFQSQLSDWRINWVDETDREKTDFDSIFGSVVTNLKGQIVKLKAKLKSITGKDLAAVKDAEAEAERIKKDNEAKRRGLDAATQKLKKEEEIRQLSPVTSVETKNKTALNLRLYNWRIDAQNGTDKKNLFKLLLTANSANPTATGASTLSLNFYYVRLGYLLEWIESNLLLYDPTKPPTPSDYERSLQTESEDGNQIFTIDTHPEKNYCLRFPSQFSSDPKVCVIPSQYNDLTDKTISWDILPELKDYIVNDRPYVGRLMNIFVNIDYIAGCLDQNTDVNGKTNLLKFLTSMFDGINDVLGNVNKLEPIFDSENNQLKIIEGSSLEKIDEIIADREKKDNNMAVFQVYGIGTNNNPMGSFVTNVDFQVQLPPNMAAMATISAQSRGNIVGENATGLSKLNAGFTDRLITLKLDKDSIEGVETGKADPKEIFKTNIQAVSKFINGLYKDKLYSKDTVESTRSSNRDIALYLTGNDALDNKMPSPFFIPFNLSLNMNGLSGMRNYERFSITEEILPYSYRSGDQKGVIDFLIKGISHSIKDNKWETKIESLTVGSNRKGKIKDQQ